MAKHARRPGTVRSGGSSVRPEAVPGAHQAEASAQAGQGVILLRDPDVAVGEIDGTAALFFALFAGTQIRIASRQNGEGRRSIQHPLYQTGGCGSINAGSRIGGRDGKVGSATAG